MAANRKLLSECYFSSKHFTLNYIFNLTSLLYFILAEIQQVLKKVEEGVELFDEIWEKVK
jgi:hypothetical protein